VAELAGAIAQEMKLSPKLVKMLLMFGVIRDPDLAELPYLWLRLPPSTIRD